MSRSVGLPARTAAGQVQRAFPSVGIQPLPTPYAAKIVAPASVGIVDPGDPLVFYVIGDHGGIKTPSPQMAVAAAIAREAAIDKPAFVWTVGDVVYFNGDADQYGPQFYEPYAAIELPIVGIPGNHDGDTTDDPSRPPLDTFLANFCAASAAIPPADPQFEYHRHTQTQPYPEWGLALDALTIIGMYSNVPSGGHLAPEQTAWLAQALKAAPAGKPLMLALHHPPFSVDAHHGGSAKMWEAITTATRAAGREPDLIETGHVHDHQRFTVRMPSGKTIPVCVDGNGGYHNLHQLASDATPGLDVNGDGSVIFEYGDASQYGFQKITVTAGQIHGEYIGVKPGTMPDGSDCTITPGLDSF